MSRRILFVFILVALLFFFPVLFLGKTLFYYDTLSQRLPSMIFFRNEILNGRLPLWNPYLYGGLPHLADPTNNVLSPFNIFYLILPPVLALNIITALAVFLSGIGMYYFSRVLKVSKIASLFIGLAFMFSGSVLTYINDVNSLLAISFIPFIFAFFTQFMRVGEQSWFLLISLATVFQFFSGHPQYVYLTWIFVSLFLIINFPKKGLKNNITKISLVALMFIGLSAIQLLPFLELMKNVFRPTNFEFASINQLKFFEIPRLFFVNFYGRLKDGTSWGPGSLLESGLAGIDGYIGFFSITFFIMALLIRFKKLKGLILLGFLALVLSFGTQLPFYSFLRQFLPFFKFFRSPSRILVFWSFFSILVAGFMFDEFLKQGRVKKDKKTLKLGILFLIAMLLFMWRRNWFIESGLKLFSFTYETVKKKPLDVFIYSKGKLRIIFKLWHENLIVIFLGLTSLLFFWFRRSFWWLLFIFLIFEGFWFGKNVFLTAPIKKTTPNSQITDFLQKETNYQRVISTGEIMPFTGLQTYWNHLQSRPPFSRADIEKNELKIFSRFKKEINMLPANLTENFKLFNPSGYTAVILKNYAQFWNSEAANSVTISKINDERLDFLGTKFLITGWPEDFIKDKYENLELVREFGDTRIYENKNVYRRAFLIDENEKIIGEAEIVSCLPSEVTIETESTTAAKLVLTDSFYPGWQTKVDGQKTEIKSFKNAFRLVPVPAGGHIVIFTYYPKSFILGSIISIGTFFILGASLWQKQKKSL